MIDDADLSNPSLEPGTPSTGSSTCPDHTAPALVHLVQPPTEQPPQQPQLKRRQPVHPLVSQPGLVSPPSLPELPSSLGYWHRASQWERLKNRLVSRCSPHRDGLFSLYSRCQPHLLCGGPMALYCGGRLRPANHRAMSQGGAGREPLCLCARVRVTIRQWHPPTLKTSGNAMVLMYKHTPAL